MQLDCFGQHGYGGWLEENGPLFRPVPLSSAYPALWRTPEPEASPIHFVNMLDDFSWPMPLCKPRCSYSPQLRGQLPTYRAHSKPFLRLRPQLSSCHFDIRAYLYLHCNMQSPIDATEHSEAAHLPNPRNKRAKYTAKAWYVRSGNRLALCFILVNPTLTVHSANIAIVEKLK